MGLWIIFVYLTLADFLNFFFISDVLMLVQLSCVLYLSQSTHEYKSFGDVGKLLAFFFLF